MREGGKEEGREEAEKEIGKIMSLPSIIYVTVLNGCLYSLCRIYHRQFHYTERFTALSVYSLTQMAKLPSSGPTMVPPASPRGKLRAPCM